MQSSHRILLQQPTVVYLGVIIFLLWLATFFNVSSLWLFAMAFLFLIEMDRYQMRRVRREIRNEERRSASQARPLSDFESADWINQALEKIWPQFLEEFISREVLKPVIPWFLDKYKPWTVKKATLQHLQLGRAPPKFMGVRTVECISGDDDLVMDFGLDFAAAEDMIAVLSVQMTRRLGLGITTNIHISGLQIEGKVRVGVKFLKGWPFISRLRLCFQNAPYVQMNARPLSTHGVNVSELPLIAGWIERMVADVFEQSLVEPNMLVLDAEKLVSCFSKSDTPNSSILGKCLDIQERAAIAIVKMKILEASELKPSDMNGLADPYVRGSFATHRFKTKVQKKTLKPRWFEEFEIPVASWELPTLLVLRVRDKDQFRDDDLGFCEVDIAKFRDGHHHDLWIPLQNVKMGRLHIALNITEDVSESSRFSEQLESNVDDGDNKSLFPERFEVISLGNGEKDGYLSIVNPGQPIRTKSWHQRQGVTRRDDTKNHKEVLESMHKETLASSSTEESDDQEMPNTKPRRHRFWGRRHHQLSSLSVPKEEFSPLENADEYLGLGSKGTTVKMKLAVAGETASEDSEQNPEAAMHQEEANAVSAETPLTPSKRDHMKSMAKGLFKHAGKAAHNLSTSLTRKGSSKKADNEDAQEPSVPATPVSEPTLPIETKLPQETGRDSTSPHQNNHAHAQGGFDQQFTKPSNLHNGMDKTVIAKGENSLPRSHNDNVTKY